MCENRKKEEMLTNQAGYWFCSTEIKSKGRQRDWKAGEYINTHSVSYLGLWMIPFHSSNSVDRTPTTGIKLHYHTLISVPYYNSPSHKHSLEIEQTLLTIIILGIYFHAWSEPFFSQIHDTNPCPHGATLWVDQTTVSYLHHCAQNPEKSSPWGRNMSKPLSAHAQVSPACKVASLALLSLSLLLHLGLHHHHRRRLISIPILLCT